MYLPSGVYSGPSSRPVKSVSLTSGPAAVGRDAVDVELVVASAGEDEVLAVGRPAVQVRRRQRGDALRRAAADRDGVDRRAAARGLALIADRRASCRRTRARDRCCCDWRCRCRSAWTAASPDRTDRGRPIPRRARCGCRSARLPSVVQFGASNGCAERWTTSRWPLWTSRISSTLPMKSRYGTKSILRRPDDPDVAEDRPLRDLRIVRAQRQPDEHLVAEIEVGDLRGGERLAELRGREGVGAAPSRSSWMTSAPLIVRALLLR